MNLHEQMSTKQASIALQDNQLEESCKDQALHAAAVNRHEWQDSASHSGCVDIEVKDGNRLQEQLSK